MAVKKAAAKKAAPAKAEKPAPKSSASKVVKNSAPVAKPAVKPAKAPAKAAKAPAKPAKAVVHAAKAVPSKKAVPAKPAAKAAPAKPAAKPAAKAVSAPKAAPAKPTAKPAPVKAAAPVAKAKPAPAPAKAAPAAKPALVAKPAAPAAKTSAVKPAAAPAPAPAPTPAPVAAKPKSKGKTPKKVIVKAPLITNKPAPVQPVMPTNVLAPQAIRQEAANKKTDLIVAHRRPDARAEAKELSGKTMINYQPEFTRSLLDGLEEKSGPVYRYSDEELAEFRELIQGRLASARKELGYLQGLITRKDEAGTEDTENRYAGMEDGSGAMEREQLAHLASRQIQFIGNLEKALVRIENKTYGICRVTGKLIDKARLRAVPHATLSIEAKKGMNK